MAYLVLARKYRPQRFGEMSGQAHVVQTLANALKRGQLAHAFLFTGPRGVGKTTAARLVAKAVNCEKGPTPEPCGVCLPCREIADGRSVDVIEIDAASNNGVDNVRDIVEAVKYRPARDRFKVFVIDEVHMLSQGAFNALLKTLEEPPEHVKFVLATTDVHKVPETIVSRCQRFDFRRLTQQQIADQLGHVAGEEGMKLSGAALAMVARAAEGGMRDALSLLDRVRASCGDTPGDAEVAEALGTVDVAAVSRMAGALLQRDGAALLAEIAALHERGLEMKRVAEELARHLRNVVVARLAPARRSTCPTPSWARCRPRPGTPIRPSSPGSSTWPSAPWWRPSWPTSPATPSRWRCSRPSSSPRAPTSPRSSPASRPWPAGRSRRPRPTGGGGPGGGRAVSAPRHRGAPRPPRRRPAVRGAASLPTPSRPRGRPPAPPAMPQASQGAAQAAVAGPLIDPAAPLAERWRAVVDEVEKVSPAAAPALKQATLRWIRDGEIGLQLPPGLMATSAERRRAEIEAVFARCFGRPTRAGAHAGRGPAGASGRVGAGLAGRGRAGRAAGPLAPGAGDGPRPPQHPAGGPPPRGRRRPGRGALDQRWTSSS